MRPFKKGFVLKCAQYGLDKSAAKELFEKIALGFAGGGAIAKTPTPTPVPALTKGPVAPAMPTQPKPAMQPKPVRR
jgi:hypothetical protein